MYRIVIFLMLSSNSLFTNSASLPSKGEYDSMHPQLPIINDGIVNENGRVKRGALPLKFIAPEMETHSEYWTNMAQNILQLQLRKNHLNKNMARNVIFFIGDGMSIATVTASRVYNGGEEQQLSFDKFPYSGLSKTYCANTQVADSACSATAYLGGVKANYATLGVTASVALNDCSAENRTTNHVASIAEWAQRNQMSTGFVTTTEVTNASPAGLYSHSANRNWENDRQLIADGGNPDTCTDIARQLIHGKIGEKLNVIMGGGRRHFLPEWETDIDGLPGTRGDGVNLIKQWKRHHRKHVARYAETREELQQVNGATVDYLFGLFSNEHMPFHLEEEAAQKPTLTDMVSKALDVLEKNDKGYLLFVEGGRIDHGHHKTQAARALDETIEFSKAIEHARLRTSEKDTLIIVSADHSHTMAMAGYSSRGNDILGINNAQIGLDRLPYATLSYANGPGYEVHEEQTGGRRNLLKLNMHRQTFEFPSTIPLAEETHGGDDVPVYASGPWAHIFTGTYEQHYIPHAIGYAACIGDGLHSCTDE
ncbi:alkaline phosphatase-like [Phlebotomus papatasi]|uniref:alkaline phosphatase-like n=1 Tax=Phlebotomus papatasi TaxID=29031 RepID=UPI0024836B72|nr:alkaline phosphatase-like [Phlebotomus papatasi]